MYNEEDEINMQYDEQGDELINPDGKSTLRLMLVVYIVIVLGIIVGTAIAIGVYSDDTVEAQLVRIDEGDASENRLTVYEYRYRYRGKRHSEFSTEPIEGKTKLGSMVTIPLMDNDRVKVNIAVCAIFLLALSIVFFRKYFKVKKMVDDGVFHMQDDIDSAELSGEFEAQRCSQEMSSKRDS